MRRAFRLLLGAGLLGSVAALAGGFLGALHPLGDSLAVFRLPLAGLALAFAAALALTGRAARRPALGLGLAAILAAAPAALSYVPRPAAGPAPGLAIYQKNLLFRLADPAPLVADILASGADIVTLQEVHPRNFPVLEALREAYPSQAWCRYGTVGGTAVLSRLPAQGAPVCAERDGLTALRLAAPEGPIWAVSLHLYWPWPHSQAPQVARLAPLIERLEGPVIVGGDFNMVPWAASTARIARAARAAKAGPTTPTFHLAGGLVGLPIDHVLLPEGWAGQHEIRPELGSDHRGVLVRVVPLS